MTSKMLLMSANYHRMWMLRREAEAPMVMFVNPDMMSLLITFLKRNVVNDELTIKDL